MAKRKAAESREANSAESCPTSPREFSRRPARRLSARLKATGLSISQLAERILVAGLSKRRENDRDKAMRALCFVLAETAHQVVGAHEFNEETKTEAPMFNWRSDPFFFRAFKLAVGQILDALEPRGNVRAPKVQMSLYRHQRPQHRKRQIRSPPDT